MTIDASDARSPFRPVAIALLVAIAAVVGPLLALGAYVYVTDRATYSSQNAQHVESVDFDAVVANATAAGYAVSGPRYDDDHAGAPVTDAPDFVERYGPDVRVQSISYTNGPSTVTIHLPSSMGDSTYLTFTNDSVVGEQYTTEDLPPEPWLVDLLVTAFDVDEQTARTYVAELERDVASPLPDVFPVRFGGEPTVAIDESPDLAAARAALTDASTTVSVSDTGGRGSFVEFFETGNGTYATILYQVRYVVVTHEADGARYQVWLDQAGGVSARVTRPAGEELSRGELVGALQQQLAAMGLPPETANAFEFDYRASRYV